VKQSLVRIKSEISCTLFSDLFFITDEREILHAETNIESLDKLNRLHLYLAGHCATSSVHSFFPRTTLPSSFCFTNVRYGGGTRCCDRNYEMSGDWSCHIMHNANTVYCRCL